MHHCWLRFFLSFTHSFIFFIRSFYSFNKHVKKKNIPLHVSVFSSVVVVFVFVTAIAIAIAIATVVQVSIAEE